jgi:hypothetical protein
MKDSQQNIRSFYTCPSCAEIICPVPAPRLVGIETNPGPPTTEQKAVSQILDRLKFLENESKMARSNASLDKKKKKKNKNSKNNNNSNSKGNFINDNVNEIKSDIPVAYDNVRVEPYHRVSNTRVQQLADQDPRYGSVRVEFCDIYSHLLTNAAVGNDVPGFNGEFYEAITPSSVSSRLIQYEEMYQWYAFRDLTISVSPEMGTQNNGLLTLAIVQTPNGAVEIPSPTTQEIAEYRPRLQTQVFRPRAMRYLYNGMKLWETSGTDLALTTQALFAAAFDNIATGATIANQISICGTIDFYKDAPPSSVNPSIILRNRMRSMNLERKVKYITRFKDAVDEILKPLLVKQKAEEDLKKAKGLIEAKEKDYTIIKF